MYAPSHAPPCSDISVLGCVGCLYSRPCHHLGSINSLLFSPHKRTTSVELSWWSVLPTLFLYPRTTILTRISNSFEQEFYSNFPFHQSFRLKVIFFFLKRKLNNRVVPSISCSRHNSTRAIFDSYLLRNERLKRVSTMAFVVRSGKVSQESGQPSFVTIGYKGMKYIRVYIYKWFNVCLTEQRASHTFNISDRFIDTGIYKALSGIVYSWCRLVKRTTESGIMRCAVDIHARTKDSISSNLG